jgi:hypothetical protein
MIEQARESLENFLKNNIEYIKNNNQHNNKLNILRKTWSDLNSEYKEYDMYLDIVWEGLTGASSAFWSWNNSCEPLKGPHAKSFKVVIRDWNNETIINNKIQEYYSTNIKNMGI